VAINLPTSGSLFADIVAICSNCSSLEISSDNEVCKVLTTLATALSISLLI
jgi:hypothetical protein